MTLHIDDDRPPPGPAVRGKGYTQIVMQLELGQSVLLPTTYSSGRALVAAIYSLRRRKRGSFQVRPDGDGVRVWRVEPPTK